MAYFEELMGLCHHATILHSLLESRKVLSSNPLGNLPY